MPTSRGMGLTSRLGAVPRPFRAPAAAAAFGGLLLLTAELSRSLETTDPALLWAPSGIYLGVLMISGRRLWPLLACAALVASIGANLLAGDSPAVSLAFAVPSAAEGLLAALVVLRLAGDRFSLERLGDVVGLVAGGAIAANALTALSAAAADVQAFGGSFSVAWLRWWGAHALGIVVVCPIVIALVSNRPRLPPRPQLAEVGLVVAGLAATALFLSSAEPLGAATVVASAGALGPLLWAGFRWSPAGAALGVLPVALVATYLAPHTADPLGLGTISSAEVVVAQVSLGLLQVASLAFAAVAAGRRHAQGRAARAGRRLREVVDAAPDAYVAIDGAGLIAEWSPAAEAMLGWTREQALGRRLHETAAPASARPAWLEELRRRAAASDPGERPSRLTAAHRDGRELAAEVTISASRPGHESATRHLFIRDVGERERVRAELSVAKDLIAKKAGEVARADEDVRHLQDGLARTLGELERARAEARRDLEAAERLSGERTRLERALDAMVMSFAEADRERMLLARRTSEMIVRYDRLGICRYASPACSELLGYERAELIGRQGADLLHPDDRRHLTRARAAEGTTAFTARLLRKDGTLARVQATVTPVRDVKGGRLVALEACVRGISEAIGVPPGGRGSGARSEATLAEAPTGMEQSRRLTEHDPLTGLYSPARFEEELRSEVAGAERYGTGGAVLVVDLDDFTALNGLLGRAGGDRLIREVSHALRGRLRRTDVAGRTLGGQFAVLLRRADGSQAIEVADALRTAAREVGAGEQLELTASVGIATFGGDRAVRAEELIVEAEIAVQDAKGAGGDRAATFEPGEERPASLGEGLGWADQIREALEQDRFRLYCEPVVALSGDGTPRHELTSRMVSASGELVAPAVFLPAAERFGAAGELDRWLLRNAIDLLAAERRAGSDAHVEVSLSTKASCDPDLHVFVARELELAGLDAAGVSIAIAEAAAVHGTDRTALFMRRLADIGCELGLDRFGSGVGSFLQVEQLPVGYVKLDHALVGRLSEAGGARLVVKSIADVASGLGLRTVAPHVSDQATLRILRAAGVGYAQGPALGLARPAAELRPSRSPARPPA